MDGCRGREWYFDLGGGDLTNDVQVFLLTYFATQIGTNVYGSGFHMQNVPESWRALHWHVSLTSCASRDTILTNRSLRLGGLDIIL